MIVNQFPKKKIKNKKFLNKREKYVVIHPVLNESLLLKNLSPLPNLAM